MMDDGWMMTLSGHIGSSNVFVCGLPPVIASLLAGVPAFLRPPSSQPEFAVLLARSWNERALLGGASLAAASWSREDLETTRALARAADRLFVFGEDATVESLRDLAGAQAPESRVLGFGDRFSVAALGRELLLDPDATDDALEGLCVDCLAWDGAGCLTPRWIFVEGDAEEAVRLARLSAPLLGRAAEDLPPGAPLDAAAGSARAGWLGRAGFDAWSRQGPGWAVAALSEARLSPAPPVRTLAFLPVTDLGALGELLAPLGPRLQGLAYGGSAERREKLATSLAPRGLSRVVEPGHLQRPPIDWNHDDVQILDALF